MTSVVWCTRFLQGTPRARPKVIKAALVFIGVRRPLYRANGSGIGARFCAERRAAAGRGGRSPGPGRALPASGLGLGWSPRVRLCADFGLEAHHWAFSVVALEPSRSTGRVEKRQN
jgi:hypothetical protein